ncbi:hypothetical protein EIP86_002816 [Pleurotus ostreatoroseus]|nr:hypothetical protein EIP86_002816 [Pleurotus ostreatoroseus]
MVRTVSGVVQVGSTQLRRVSHSATERLLRTSRNICRRRRGKESDDGDDVLDQIKILSGLLGAIADGPMNVPLLKSVCVLTERLVEIVQAVRKNADDCQLLIERLCDHLNVIATVYHPNTHPDGVPLGSERDGRQFHGHIVLLHGALETTLAEVQAMIKRPKWRKVVFHESDKSKIAACQDRLQHVFTRFQLGATIVHSHAISAAHADIEQVKIQSDTLLSHTSRILDWTIPSFSPRVTNLPPLRVSSGPLAKITLGNSECADLGRSSILVYIDGGPFVQPNGTHQTFEFKRIAGSPAVEDLVVFYNPPLPERRVLTPHGDLHLRIGLGKRMTYWVTNFATLSIYNPDPITFPADSHGRDGVVHEVEVVLEGSSPEVKKYHLPPLVAKISRKGSVDSDLRNEMYIYEELSALYGACLPRCFGLFWGDIPPPHSAVPPSFDPYSPVEELQKQIAAITDRRLSRVSGTVWILLLERLEGYLPLGKVIPAETKEEIYALYDELAQCHIDPVNYSWGNIMRALPSPPGLPSRPSPRTGRVYEWRLIDFNRAKRSNMTAEDLCIQNESWMEDILGGLEGGRFVLPSDTD